MAPDPADIALYGILGDIAEVAGVAAALQVAHARGGTRAFICTIERLKDDNWLVQAVGREAAIRIIRGFGVGHIEVPLGPFGGNRGRLWLAIQKALAAGQTPNAIARRLGVHVKTVRRHKSGESGAASPDPLQGKLF